MAGALRNLVLAVAMAVVLVLTAVGPAAAGPAWCEGAVVDALDGLPVAGAIVEAEGLGVHARTGAQGGYRLELPAGVWRLRVEAAGYRPALLANQHTGEAATPPRPGRAHLWPARFPADFSPGPQTFGAGHGTGPGPGPSGSVYLPGAHWLAPVPAELPQTIRVARYFTVGCSGEIQRIDTLDFEDYVKGVVCAEVGVFRGVEGGPDAARACWQAFAVAARSYALHFVLTSPYDGYDINDTACNQVYKDDRDPDVSAAVESTAGQILVKAADPSVIDRYFYAASCAHHGTEPAYRSGEILPDPTGVRACVGSWCGHDTCAGHADNPELPGDDSCLVWGTCQWGSVERSMAGDSYRDILGHYQPACAIIDMAGPATGVLTGVVYRNPDLQDWIPGASVTIQGGPTVTFDGVTPWEFRLEPGTYRVEAAADGYLPGFVERTVEAHQTVWGSIGLDPDPQDEDGGTDAGEDAGEDAGSDPGPADTGTDAGSDPDPAADAGADRKTFTDNSGGCGCQPLRPDGATPPPILLAALALLALRRRPSR